MRIRQNIRYEKLESPNDNNGKYHLKTNALCYFLLSVQVNIVLFLLILTYIPFGKKLTALKLVTKYVIIFIYQYFA